MAIQKIVSFLVSPGKNLAEPPQPIGADIPLNGKLFEMLRDVYIKSDTECDIPIRFTIGGDGIQTNEVRGLLIDFIQQATLENCITIAQRLRNFTTNKSGLGLFFIILGRENQELKVVLSRFPADQGILAETRREGLQVRFIERVFMKNAASYKAALYQGTSIDADFWSGYAVDKQINNEVANYWIRDFLSSYFKTTDKAGTKRLAVALREASKLVEDINTKEEIVAVGTLMRGFANTAISAQSIIDRFNLSDSARNAIISKFPNEELINDMFTFDTEEFMSNIPFASIELDNGATLTSHSDRFNETFQKEVINQTTNEYRFTTQGRVIDEKLRARR